MTAPPLQGTRYVRSAPDTAGSHASKSVVSHVSVGLTGGATTGRAGLFAMLAAAHRGVDVVLVEDLSRLSRTTYLADALHDERKAEALAVHAADVGVTSEDAS